jgi:hypothetical protein
VYRARAYKGSKLGPEKQARQNPKVGFGTGPAIRPYRNRSKRNTGGKCSICSDNTFLSPFTLKPPFIAPHLSLKNYITRLYPPLKQIDNKSYLASNKVYVGCNSKMQFLEYKDNPAKSLNRERDIN